MPHDELDRPNAGHDDDETRSLGAMAEPEPVRSSMDDETRQLDPPELVEAIEVSGGGRVASIGSLRSSRSSHGDSYGSRRGGSSDDDMAGERIGRFVVLGTLGRGGMGTVYEAFDRTLDRKVAVKVLHSEVAAQYQEELIREAQALAQLSHPNVVQVYEAGEVDERCYVAMELVQGKTLRRWIKREPRPSWRECLEVYLLAGAGLAAAHDRGLVHCDFKPSNAVVDEEGQVKVLDFGLARVVQVRGLDLDARVSAGDSLISTVSSELRSTSSRKPTVVGTPAYMPLEQMEGDEVDARGDQFSFCVALYEAVFGVRPFRGKHLSELKEAKREQRIEAPSRSSKAPIALREILLRGLAADPDDRWPSMQELLERLGRLIDPWRRRRWFVVAGAVALAGTLAGAAVAYQSELDQRCTGARAQLDGIWDGERRTALQDAILDTQLSYAEDTWERVAKALDGYADAWAGMHTEVCEATSVRQEQSAAVMDLRMGCLRGRRIALREAVEVLVEAAPSRLAQAVPLVNNLPRVSHCEDVEALRAELPPPEDPEVARAVEALREQLVEVRTLHHAGSYDEALEEAEGVVRKTEDLDYAPLEAEALLERGMARQEKAQYEEAEGDLERAYLLAAELGHTKVTSNAVRELAIVVGHDQARHDFGLQWGKTAVALARRELADPREEAAALSAIGMMLMKKGELAEALAHQQRALHVFEESFGPEAPDIADLLLNMGNVLQKQGRLDEALEVLRRALAIREKALGPHHPTVAGPLTTIGAVLIQQGELDAALGRMQRVLSIREGALGSHHPDVATALNNIGAVLKQQGELDRAREQFQRALEILEESLGPAHPRLAYPLNNIGEVLRTQDKGEEALDYLRRALTVTEESVGKEHADVASSLINLGNLLYQEERYDDAKVQYERALEIQRKALPADHPFVAWSQLGLAKIALRQERPDDAREHAERAVYIREQAKVPAVFLAEARFLLARALWSEPGERARARTLAEQARDAWTKAGADDQHTKAYLKKVDAWLTEHEM